jgi:dynein heavy chain 1
MATAELLRSNSLTTGMNGLIPHDPSTSNNTNGPIESSVSQSQPFDSSIFRTYLLSLLPPVLGASPEELESLFDEEFEERVSRFAAEGGGVIYVVKVRDDAEGDACSNLESMADV